VFSVSLLSDTRPFQDLQTFVSKYPEYALDEAERSIFPRATRLVKRKLGQAPGPVKHPIEWTSEKQRRAFFATDGFGHGIPYQRSGNLERMWEVVILTSRTGFTLSVRNPNPAAPFVYGIWQQQMHKNTGWPLARPIIDGIAADLLPIVEQLPANVMKFFSTRGR
jgi:hypothetical protein